jgi:hypothetical protein
MSDLANIQSLVKALEAGGYNAAPSSLVQGAALQVEDLSPVMQNVTFDNSHIKLQKMLNVDSCKSTLAQFDRQLSYGVFGGSAQIEGAIGQEETSDFVRIVVPMAYYSHTRRVTLVANLVATVDGKKAEERAAEDAAKKLAGDVEFDAFRGKADFSNAGVFDGNPLLISSALPNILGLEPQIRQSDSQRNSQDLMFGEFGSDDTVVIPGGGTLSQEMVEDASVRSAMNLGSADKLIVDPKVLSAYNKITLAKERIILAGSPQDSTGAELRRQWTSTGTVNVESSRFLSGKTRPAAARSVSGAPPAPTGVTSTGGSSGTGLAAGAYVYYATAVNELGESALFQTTTTGGAVTITAGQVVTVTITAGTGTSRAFNVYRSNAGGTLASARFVGRAISGGTTTVFLDLGNKRPGFVTGFLVDSATMSLKELAPYSRVKLAQTDLSSPEAHFRFLTLAVTQPRKNVLVDNLVGSF